MVYVIQNRRTLHRRTRINTTSTIACIVATEALPTVSVALKKRIESGTAQYLIEISIDPEGRLRWPEEIPIESKRVVKFVAFGIVIPKSGWKIEGSLTLHNTRFQLSGIWVVLVRCVQNTAFFKIKIDFYFINT
jgi:hypothetical protein